MLDHGIGFTDVGTGNPGTDSSEFKSLDFHRWRQDFYDRMQDHMKRASDSIGCNCSQCGAPALVAFAGKRQYLELLNWGKKGKNKSRTVSQSRGITILHYRCG